MQDSSLTVAILQDSVETNDVMPGWVSVLRRARAGAGEGLGGMGSTPPKGPVFSTPTMLKEPEKLDILGWSQGGRCGAAKLPVSGGGILIGGNKGPVGDVVGCQIGQKGGRDEETLFSRAEGFQASSEPLVEAGAPSASDLHLAPVKKSEKRVIAKSGSEERNKGPDCDFSSGQIGQRGVSYSDGFQAPSEAILGDAEALLGEPLEPDFQEGNKGPDYDVIGFQDSNEGPVGDVAGFRIEQEVGGRVGGGRGGALPPQEEDYQARLEPPREQSPPVGKAKRVPITTTQHARVQYRCLRASVDWRNITYNCVPSEQVLAQLGASREFIVELYGDAGNFYGIVEQKNWRYFIKLGDITVIVEDPFVREQFVEEGRCKPRSKKAAGANPVRIEIPGTTFTLYEPGEIEALIEGIEWALFYDQPDGVPSRSPSRTDLAVDIELRGPKREVERFKKCLYEVDQVNDNWVRRTRKSATREYSMKKVSSTNGKCRQLNLGSRSGLNIAVYEKSEQVMTKDVRYREALHAAWKANGWDGEREVVRVEIRAVQDWLRKQRIPEGKYFDQLRDSEFDEQFHNIFRTAVQRNRFCPGTGNKKKRESHPFWQFVEGCSDRFVYNEEKAEPINIVRADRAQQLEEMVDAVLCKRAALSEWTGKSTCQVDELLDKRQQKYPGMTNNYLESNGYTVLGKERELRDRMSVPSASTEFERLLRDAEISAEYVGC